MNPTTTSIAATLALIAALLAVGVSADFHTERVHLLDTFKTAAGCKTHLFRGALPLDSSSLEFVYEPLVSAMEEAAKKVDVNVHAKDLRIIDLSLLHPDSEKEAPEIEAERNFFEQNPSKGFFFSVPIQGSSANPSFLNTKAQREIATGFNAWSKESLPSLIDAIRYLLTSDETVLLNNSPSLEQFEVLGFTHSDFANALNVLLGEQQGPCADVAIYFHCQHGMDRTGEVAASYLLRYGGFLQQYDGSSDSFTKDRPTSLQQVVDMNEQVLGRHITAHNQRALSWMCLSLAVSGMEEFESLNCSIDYYVDSEESEEVEDAIFSASPSLLSPSLVSLFLSFLFFATRFMYH